MSKIIQSCYLQMTLSFSNRSQLIEVIRTALFDIIIAIYNLYSKNTFLFTI